MFEEYKEEYRENKASIDKGVLWCTIGAIAFIVILVVL